MLTETTIAGCFIVEPKVHADARGSFAKPFALSQFPSAPTWEELYWSTSNANVVRGLHFQTPPLDHQKLAWCTAGKVLDVVVDLRSDNYGEVISVELTAESGRGILIPPGCAHGFLSLVDNTTMVYAVSTEYNAEHDQGVRWDSIAFDWPVSNAIVSDRDAGFPTLADFNSPF